MGKNCFATSGTILRAHRWGCCRPSGQWKSCGMLEDSEGYVQLLLISDRENWQPLTVGTCMMDDRRPAFPNGSRGSSPIYLCLVNLLYTSVTGHLSGHATVPTANDKHLLCRSLHNVSWGWAQPTPTQSLPPARLAVCWCQRIVPGDPLTSKEHSGRCVIISWYENSSRSVTWITPANRRRPQRSVLLGLRVPSNAFRDDSCGDFTAEPQRTVEQQDLAEGFRRENAHVLRPVGTGSVRQRDTFPQVGHEQSKTLGHNAQRH